MFDTQIFRLPNPNITALLDAKQLKRHFNFTRRWAVSYKWGDHPGPGLPPPRGARGGGPNMPHFVTSDLSLRAPGAPQVILLPQSLDLRLVTSAPVRLYNSKITLYLNQL